MTAPTLDMTGRRVLISGASSGIGRAMAATFADAGAELVLVDIDERGLELACGELAAGGCAAIRHAVLDLDDKSAVDAFWDAGGSVPDTLVNNAGIYPMRRFMDLDKASLDRVMHVNLESLFWMCQGFIRARGKLGGVIINVSSIEAYTAFKREMVAYTTSKTGVLGFTRALATTWHFSSHRTSRRTCTAQPSL